MENKLKGETRLEKRVASIVNRHARDGYTVKGYLEDLLQHGCQSGMVGELIYYHDTIRFYNLYRKEIDTMLADTMTELGAKSPSDVFGDKWDNEDPLARDTENQNLLAWFAFEETARVLAERVGIEI